jgi:hypothetical protein
MLVFVVIQRGKVILKPHSTAVWHRACQLVSNRIEKNEENKIQKFRKWRTLSISIDYDG